MTHPDQSLSLQPAAGWVLVPVKPTDLMIERMRDQNMCGSMDNWNAWASALNAAPKAPAPCIGKDPLCPCADGDVCHYVATKKTKAWVHSVASSAVSVCACCKGPAPGWSDKDRQHGWRFIGGMKEYHCREAAIDD